MRTVSLPAISVLCAAAMLGCGDDDSPQPSAASRSNYRPPSQARPLRCKQAVRVRDASGDARAAVRGERVRIPPYVDLRQFELMVNEDGVCARWTTATPAPPGTIFQFTVYGPPYRNRLDVIVLQGHGFLVELNERGAVVTDANGGRERLRAHVRRSGRTISVFAPRAQLDRRPRKLPERRPFPRNAFAFDARVHTRHAMDIWPQETDGQAGWVNGRICLPSCNDRRAIDTATKQRPEDAPSDHDAD